MHLELKHSEIVRHLPLSSLFFVSAVTAVSFLARCGERLGKSSNFSTGGLIQHQADHLIPLGNDHGVEQQDKEPRVMPM